MSFLPQGPQMGYYGLAKIAHVKLISAKYYHSLPTTITGK